MQYDVIVIKPISWFSSFIVKEWDIENFGDEKKEYLIRTINIYTYFCDACMKKENNYQKCVHVEKVEQHIINSIDNDVMM